MVVEAVERLAIRKSRVLGDRIVEQRNAPIVVERSSSLNCVVVVDSSSVAEVRALIESSAKVSGVQNAKVWEKKGLVSESVRF